MSSIARLGMLLLALVNLAVGAGLFFDAGWALAIWPWTDQPLDRLVLSSFMVAGAGGVAWIGLTGEWGAMTGALLDICVFHAGALAWSLMRWLGPDVPTPNAFTPPDGPEAVSALGLQAAAYAALLVVELGVLAVVARRPLRDTRPADRLLVGSFAVFALTLLVTGTLLLLHRPIWPWPLAPASATMFGLLFMGSAAYFLWGLRRPTWHRMKGQLVAFLLYDLVLAQPYLHLGDGELGYALNYASLGVYWLVILYSGGLSVWYLFLNPRTRSWAVQEGGP